MDMTENRIMELLSKQFIVFFAKVVSHTGDRATVTPLFKTQYNKPFTNITAPVYTLGSSNAGIDFQMQAGDLVLCLTLRNSIAQATMEEQQEVKRIDYLHNLADTIVLSLKRNNSTNSLKLTFGDSSITLEEAGIDIKGKVTISGNTEINGTLDLIKTTAGVRQVLSVDTHKHTETSGNTEGPLDTNDVLYAPETDDMMPDT